MAPVLDSELSTICADTFGNPLVHGSLAARDHLQIDHVPDANASAMGKRAPSDLGHLISICPRHHLHGWATARRGRDLEREYLLRFNYPSSTEEA